MPTSTTTTLHRALDEFQVVRLSQLKVDRSYQRRYDHKLVKGYLTANDNVFDMVQAGPILVNKRRKSDRHYWVVDGQHRVGIASEAGETEIIAEVLVGLTQKQEAELRVKRHMRKADSKPELFRARLEAGESKPIAIKAMVESFGGYIVMEGHSKRGIQAVATLERIYDVSPAALRKTLAVIQQAFGEVTGRTANSYTLMAVHWLLTHHDFEMDMDAFYRRARKTPIKAIDRKARVYAAAGGSMWKNYYKAMLDVYNYRQTTADKLVPQER